eukprot:CAMPEP_0176191068 /NCGR_PEP_ID=MMETSP0121_2-20121125/4274_1 /TAXON_ID=160619 /ORGANISM="Kryptoperidinium foliaceum, Strain CCMP 1326" /LENGTH=174 /DNA_ID=CAMNT_0017529731 /DNA_START=443 /DNA_END=964 /DNA_ORIENTATION=-
MIHRTSIAECMRHGNSASLVPPLIVQSPVGLVLLRLRAAPRIPNACRLTVVAVVLRVSPAPRLLDLCQEQSELLLHGHDERVHCPQVDRADGGRRAHSSQSSWPNAPTTAKATRLDARRGVEAGSAKAAVAAETGKRAEIRRAVRERARRPSPAEAPLVEPTKPRLVEAVRRGE